MTKRTKSILQTIDYFDLFSYPPTAKEIHLFLSQEEAFFNVDQELDRLVKKRRLKVISLPAKTRRYYLANTLGEYTIKTFLLRKKWAEDKKRRGEKYWRWLSFFSVINLVAISGSVAMNQARMDDDLDLFIITSPNRLWTGRLTAVLLASIMGLKRGRKMKKAKDKVCLNLFFDGKDLTVPQIKQTEYVAHEILQMKPIVDKHNTYRRFLAANQWITKFFPNFRMAKTKIVPKRDCPCFGASWWEKIFRRIQLFFINRHRTTEMITATQLWFFPDDYGEKIKKRKKDNKDSPF